MQPTSHKNTRAEQSRINGAKSRGPKTPQGKHKAATASLQHGLYATVPTLRPLVDEPHYQALRAHYQSDWAPTNPYLADKVDDLVAYRWELNRLREVRRQFMARTFAATTATFNEKDGISVVCEAELRANECAAISGFDLRIRRCNLEISRIERDLLRLNRHFENEGASQDPLKTQDAEPEHNPIAWAEDTFDLALDVHQADILTTQAPTTVLNAARYSGKTTALALRALYESVHHPEKQIVCLSPANTLFDKVKEFAAIAGHAIPNIATTYSANADLTLIDDAAAIANQPSLHTKQLIIAGTPLGTQNYFYQQWTSRDTAKLFAPATHCDTITQDFRNRAQSALDGDTYRQEFLCEFLEKPRPRCDLDALPEAA